MLAARDIEVAGTPAALASLADVKAALNITVGTYDTALNALIAEASAQIEAYCGSIFGARAVTERHYVEESGAAIVLRYAPAVSLTSLEVASVAQTLTDFRLNLGTATLRRVDGCAFGVGEHKIVYSAGYASIPPGVSRAALELVKYLYNANTAQDDVSREQTPDVGAVDYRSAKERTLCANGVALPASVALMLAPYKVVFVC